MKTILTSILIFSATCAFAQVAIGKEASGSNAISLEFYDGQDNKRALVLPWVNSAAEVRDAVDGTLIFDTSDKKVKYKKGGTWFDLSVDNTGRVDTSMQKDLREDPNAKTIIGTDNSAANTPGILVLSDTNKAMVLPKVASPHLNIINPEPGTIVYDTVTKQLAVYNGAVWSFWRPAE